MRAQAILTSRGPVRKLKNAKMELSINHKKMQSMEKENSVLREYVRSVTGLPSLHLNPAKKADYQPAAQAQSAYVNASLHAEEISGSPDKPSRVFHSIYKPSYNTSMSEVYSSFPIVFEYSKRT